VYVILKQYSTVVVAQSAERSPKEVQCREFESREFESPEPSQTRRFREVASFVRLSLQRNVRQDLKIILYSGRVGFLSGASFEKFHCITNRTKSNR
jgi:hypothetical protein